MIVALTGHDLELARRVARERTADSRRAGFRTKGLQPSDRVASDDMIGAAGELAVCRFLGVEWQTELRRFRLADVRSDIEVRATRVGHGGLVVYLDDPPGKRYLLAVADLPAVRLVGWLPGDVAKDRKWLRRWNRGNTTYLIPQRDLRPVSTLPGAPRG